MTAYKKKMSDVGEGVELHLTQQEFEELFDIIEMGVSFYSQSFGITEKEESERRRKLFAWRKNYRDLYPLTNGYKKYDN